MLHNKSSSTSEGKEIKNDMMKYFQEEQDHHRRFLVTGDSSRRREEYFRMTGCILIDLGKNNDHHGIR
jgi:hypothetical protein